MTYFEAVLYGAVQGITEYLPISSSAHLILLPRFLGNEDPGLTFDVFLHLGTLFATLIYFWKDWLGIVRTLPGVGTRIPKLEQEASLFPWYLVVVATVPALIAGGLLNNWVETVLRGNQVLMTTLTVGGLLLFAVDHFASRERNIENVSLKDALWIGIAQCFALMPGISRSGSTITGGRLLGFDRASAARFSFLISAPITAAAIVFKMRHFDELLSSELGAGPLLVAGFSSFAFGCITIGALLRMLRRFGYLTFALYRVLLAAFIYQQLGV